MYLLFIVLFIVLLLTVLIGLSKEFEMRKQNLWLIGILVINLSLMVFYISYYYYKKNKKGVKGFKGLIGDKGKSGPNGYTCFDKEAVEGSC